MKVESGSVRSLWLLTATAVRFTLIDKIWTCSKSTSAHESAREFVVTPMRSHHRATAALHLCCAFHVMNSVTFCTVWISNFISHQQNVRCGLKCARNSFPRGVVSRRALFTTKCVVKACWRLGQARFFSAAEFGWKRRANCRCVQRLLSLSFGPLRCTGEPWRSLVASWWRFS